MISRILRDEKQLQLNKQEVEIKAKKEEKQLSNPLYLQKELYKNTLELN